MRIMPRGHRRTAGLGIALAILAPCHARGNVVRVPQNQPTIQAGILATANGDTVLVANGTYTGAGNRAISFGGRAIVVRSVGGSAACTVDAQLAARGFVFDSAEPTSARLEGFTILRGMDPTKGGGIYIAGVSQPTITDCHVTQCRTGDGTPGTIGVAGGTGGVGAGVYVIDALPTFVRCVFSGNQTGRGGDGFVNGSGVGGSAGGSGGAGAGIYVAVGATVTMRWCIVSGNTTGAGGQGGSSVVCVPPFSCQTLGEDGGHGGDGGGIFAAGTVSMINGLLTANRTGIGAAAGADSEFPFPAPGHGGDGAGWRGTNSPGSVLSCTVQGNEVAAVGPAGQPAGTGGGINGTATVVNSIVWGNTSTQISSGNTVNYSDVQGGYASGTGNLAVNPLFVNAAGGNLRLQNGSPCIDAGQNSSVPANILVDLDGIPRIQNGDGIPPATVDMGPYERADPSPVEIGDEIQVLRLDGTTTDSGGAVRFHYRAPFAAHELILEVFRVDGRRVRTLRIESPASRGTVMWDRLDAGGMRVVRGVYIVRLRAGAAHDVAKLLLSRP